MADCSTLLTLYTNRHSFSMPIVPKRITFWGDLGSVRRRAFAEHTTAKRARSGLEPAPL